MKLKQITPTILAIASVFGLGATVYFAVKETPDANENLNRAKENKHDELSKADTTVILVKSYKKTAIFGVATVACIIGSNVSNKRNQALLATAYPVLEQSYKEYKDKVKEVLGLDAHQKVMDEIAKDHVDHKKRYISAPGCFMSSNLDVEDDLEEPEVIRTFYDAYSQRYFESTLQDVIQAEYHINRNFTLGKAVSLNEWYDFLGIPPVKDGDDKFWMINDDGIFWIDFDHHTAEIDDMEVIVIDMVYGPELSLEDVENY